MILVKSSYSFLQESTKSSGYIKPPEQRNILKEKTMMNFLKFQKNVFESYECCYFQDRIEHTQKHVSLLNQSITNLAHKTSKIRDAGDEMVRVCRDFSERGTFNELFTLNMKQFAQCLAAVEDHRDSMVERFNSQVIKDFAEYEETLKFAKNDVKMAVIARDKEYAKQKKLNHVVSKNAHSIQTVKAAEADNELSNMKVKELQDKLMDYMNKFEKDKHVYVQELLKNFLLIQLSFTTQAIQVYSLAYKCLINDNSSFDAKGFLRDIGKDLYSKQLEFKPETLERRSLPSSSSSSPYHHVYHPSSTVGSGTGGSQTNLQGDNCRVSRGIIRANLSTFKTTAAHQQKQQQQQKNVASTTKSQPHSSSSSPVIQKSSSLHHVNNPKSQQITDTVSTILSTSATTHRLSSVLNSTGDSTNLSDSIGGASTDKGMPPRPPPFKKKDSAANNVNRSILQEVAGIASDCNKSSTSSSSRSSHGLPIQPQHNIITTPPPPRRLNTTTSSTTSTLLVPNRSPNVRGGRSSPRLSNERTARLARNDEDLTTEDGGADDERGGGGTSSTRSSSLAAATQFRGGSQSKLIHYTETQL